MSVATTFANVEQGMKIGLRQFALQSALQGKQLGDSFDVVLSNAKAVIEFMMNGGDDVVIANVSGPEEPAHNSPILQA